MFRFLGALLALISPVLLTLPAHAASQTTTTTTTTTSTAAWDDKPNVTPDLLSLSGGYMNFDKTEPHRQAADWRVEYRSHIAWQPLNTLGFHPFIGGEITSHMLTYGLGGFAMDWNVTKHGIFTWSEGAGYLDSGNMRTMGGTLQFRSQAEFGYRFDNDMRLTAAFSHISDAKLTRVNPGAEIIGVYFHVPIRTLVSAVQ